MRHNVCHWNFEYNNLRKLEVVISQSYHHENNRTVSIIIVEQSGFWLDWIFGWCWADDADGGLWLLATAMRLGRRGNIASSSRPWPEEQQAELLFDDEEDRVFVLENQSVAWKEAVSNIFSSLRPAANVGNNATTVPRGTRFRIIEENLENWLSYGYVIFLYVVSA